MIFPFEVKKNGIYYPAGTEVPSGFTGAEMPPKKPGKVETKVEWKDKDDSEKVLNEPVKARKYTEEELNLPYMKLKSLALKEGFKVEKTAKADDIKEMLRSI